VRVEVFVDDPDAFIEKAIAAGNAIAHPDGIKNTHTPWGVHRQGGFTDPFGHKWSVGDKSPLTQYKLDAE
jgi:PhnB protein